MRGAPDRSRRYDESRDCLSRVEAAAYLAACPGCGGELCDLAVARE